MYEKQFDVIFEIQQLLLWIAKLFKITFLCFI